VYTESEANGGSHFAVVFISDVAIHFCFGCKGLQGEVTQALNAGVVEKAEHSSES